MKKTFSILKDTLVTFSILVICFTLCILIQKLFDADGLIPAIFVLGVFLTSVITKAYFYGIASSLISVFAVNFAFTFPYFKFNFTIPENLVSALIMIAITLITCGLTEKLKYQETLKAESEREKTRANLLRAVSHDLRTPLTTIYGSCSAILENKDDLSAEQIDKMLFGIQQDSQWLYHMVENLLSITKLSDENVKIVKTPIAIDELIDSVLLKFYKRYPKQALSVDIPDKIVLIPMDVILIEQVIINILENAMLHAKGIDTLVLKVSLIQNKAIFEIKDNGCGIPNEELKNIFTGYCNPSDSKRSNSGIGLSVCKTIIEAHGGNISAENIKSGGMLFRFSLNTEVFENDEQ